MNNKYSTSVIFIILFVLIVFSPTMVSAKTDAMVIKDEQENYYQYDRTALKDDVVNKALGLKSPLYDDFIQKKKAIVSYHDDKTGYVDSEFVIDAAIQSCLDGGPCGAVFTLDKCTEVAINYPSSIMSFTKPIQTRVISSGSVINGQIITMDTKK